MKVKGKPIKEKRNRGYLSTLFPLEKEKKTNCSNPRGKEEQDLAHSTLKVT